MTERTKIDRSAVRSEWATRGFSCELWVDAPGSVWTDFVHDVDELVLVLEGELLLEMSGRIMRLEPGDEAMIPARTRHTVRNTTERATRWLHGYRLACA